MIGKRLILLKPRKIELQEFEIDPLPDDGILVRNEFTAISIGTEINNWLHGGNPGTPLNFPRQTGYCNSGTVLETGPQVTTVKPGDRIAGQSGHSSHAILRTGFQRVPDNVSLESAALMVMAAIAIRGIRVGHVCLGESVVIFGLGVIGQIAALFARIAGATPIIGIDIDPFRLKLAKELSVDFAVSGTGEIEVFDAVNRICHDDGANVVIEATGKPNVYPQAVKLAATGGRLIGLGSPRGMVPFNFLDEVHLREVSVHGAFHPITPDQDHLYYHWTKDRDRRLIMRLMEDGRLPLDKLITHVVRPEECLETYRMLAENPKRVLGVLYDWRN